MMLRAAARPRRSTARPTIASSSQDLFLLRLLCTAPERCCSQRLRSDMGSWRFLPPLERAQDRRENDHQAKTEAGPQLKAGFGLSGSPVPPAHTHSTVSRTAQVSAWGCLGNRQPPAYTIPCCTPKKSRSRQH